MHEPGVHRYTQFTDENGAPEGGQSFGPGYCIAWQRGPLGRGEERIPANGAFVESVLHACLDRLQHYQSTRFACHENAEAIHHISRALDFLDARTKAREARGVEGTHAV